LKTIKTISDANRTTRKGFNSHEPASISRRGEREKSVLRPDKQGLYTRSRRFEFLDVQQGAINQSIKSNIMNKILSIINSAFRKLVPDITFPFGFRLRFLVWAAMAFVCAISFMNIDSYWADKAGLNWLLWVVGIVLALIVSAIAAIGFGENKKD
jgi:hypothetical protein